MQLSDLLASVNVSDGSATISIPSTWRQGRTTYGGLSSALAHHVAQKAFPDVPPLRSGQIAFVGPIAGECTVSVELLRRGKNTAFVSARTTSEAGVGLMCTFIFMNPRDSHVTEHGLDRNEAPPIPGEGETRNGPPEFFTYHFDYPEKRLDLSQRNNRLEAWHRLRDDGEHDVMTELLCIGDALPPSAMGLMSESGPVSSMNWQVNMLTDKPETEGGWWLLSSETHHAENGASSQYMTVRNSRLEPVMTAMQSVALFV
ncbi:thioesterase family protein [Alterisphingorhabdus coralli]|uniref:Thioesterase family protein n=1 Tax=Alterisphingorhabdus coralli TaxID=3071408 RepID=A0AA97FC80_9SPHN|nr:thioesterase family protein [Parasphingorhabdus sp. SCSIO 66989]WOE76390.1 thioesterase family protein [Parasphingorhabdus sp. SCSIO 66989]